jgi:hypothetical protein
MKRWDLKILFDAPSWCWPCQKRSGVTRRTPSAYVTRIGRAYGHRWTHFVLNLFFRKSQCGSRNVGACLLNSFATIVLSKKSLASAPALPICSVSAFRRRQGSKIYGTYESHRKACSLSLGSRFSSLASMFLTCLMTQSRTAHEHSIHRSCLAVPSNENGASPVLAAMVNSLEAG